MIHPTEKVPYLLPALHGASGRTFTGRVAFKTRQVLYAAALVTCGIVIGNTIKHRLLSKVHPWRIGEKMRAKLDTLLRNLPHLSPQDFEAYIARSLTGAALQLVEGHISVCAICKEEVEIVQQAISGYESGILARDPSPGLPMTQSFRWTDNSTLWIDDAVYSLSIVGEAQNKVLVEGLTPEALEKMAEEDARAPGTHLVSIDNGGAELIAPLSKFATTRRAPEAGGDLAKEDAPGSSARSVTLDVEVFADGRAAVFLSTRAASA